MLETQDKEFVINNGFTQFAITNRVIKSASMCSHLVSMLKGKCFDYIAFMA